MEFYNAASDRYDLMPTRRCGKSGVILPQVSLGLWHNFGSVDSFANARNMLFRAFDLGIFHFDLANNYGPPYGSAEANFGKVMASDLAAYRDELIISTKAGYDMWSGPYGDWGSRKYLLASLDQSLKRLGLEYVAMAGKAKETAARKRAEGDELTERVAEVLSDELTTIADITELIGDEAVSTAKTQYRLNQLVKMGRARKEEITIEVDGKKKKAMAFAIADAE